MNDERILKYLSGLLNEEEIKLFEAEIARSDELKERLKSVKNSLDKMKSAAEPEVDETYFVNLTPIIKEKSAKSVKKKFIPQISFVVSTIAAALIFIFYYGNNSKNDDFSLAGNLLEDSSVIKEVNDYFSNPLDEDFLYYSVEENSPTAEFNPNYELINENEAFEELMTINLPVVDDYELLDNIGNTDLLELEKAIKEIKIF